MYVEVFKTNVTCNETAKRLVHQLLSHFPLCEINFDLDDCDCILRVEGETISITDVIAVMDHQGYSCEVLV